MRFIVLLYIMYSHSDRLLLSNISDNIVYFLLVYLDDNISLFIPVYHVQSLQFGV